MGFEPIRLSARVFETLVSAIPPRPLKAYSNRGGRSQSPIRRFNSASPPNPTTGWGQLSTWKTAARPSKSYDEACGKRPDPQSSYRSQGDD